MKRAVTPTLFAEQSANLAFREIAGLNEKATSGPPRWLGRDYAPAPAVRIGQMTAPGSPGRLTPTRTDPGPAPPEGAPR